MDNQELIDYYSGLDRSIFIDNEYKSLSGNDEPLPIGYGQTISQPSLVLEMTYLLSPDKKSSVLEIGTGSGYQTALLARFSKHVYTIELLEELGYKARETLGMLGFINITYLIGDGSRGWSEFAPFDRIIATASAEKLPQELLDQLNFGGRMVIPIGARGKQELKLITKDLNGKISVQTIEEVRFVEMKGKYGWTKKENE